MRFGSKEISNKDKKKILKELKEDKHSKKKKKFVKDSINLAKK